jgi:predicted alpha/beta hydrolase family esterase
MREMITLPGINNSGETHWQSRWERSEAGFRRFQPASWDEPELTDWVQSLENAVAACANPPVLIAHSLACLLVAHWAGLSESVIAGAFLVSVPDPDGAGFPTAAASFRDVPTQKMAFPSLVITSSDDPYGTVDYARSRSREWRSGFVVAGALGHINEASHLGEWEQGRALLTAFVSGLPRSA